MLGFSQKSPVELPISPTASLRGIRPPSSGLSASTSYGTRVSLPRDLGGLPICKPMSVSTHPGQQLRDSCPFACSTRLDSPVDLEASVLSGQAFGQSNNECLADAIRVLLETSLGFLFLSNERLQISNTPIRSIL